MANDRIEFVRLGLRKREQSIRLKLRWDRSPLTCAAIASLLPVENQIWHAKYANNEVYTLIPAYDEPPPGEWFCAYPGPGDLMSIPIPAGFVLPPGAPPMDTERGIVDLAYFYDRGNSLLHGPSGPAVGNIFATAISIEDIDRMAVACNDVWRAGQIGEALYIEAD